MLVDVQTFSSLALVGLIWTIQLVHYPSFHYVSQKSFVEFEEMHQSRITLIVAPLMFVELVSAGAILFFYPDEGHFLLNFFIIIAIWMVTAFISMPCHQKLSRGYDRGVVDKLVNTNWIRTILWTIKSLILVIS